MELKVFLGTFMLTRFDCSQIEDWRGPRPDPLDWERMILVGLFLRLSRVLTLWYLYWPTLYE